MEEPRNSPCHGWVGLQRTRLPWHAPMWVPDSVYSVSGRCPLGADWTSPLQTPPPEGTEDRTPKEAQGDHQPKTGNTKPGTAAHREKGHRNEKKKEESHQPSPKERGWRDRDHKARDRKKKKKEKTKAQKTHPENPAKKGSAQPRPGPSTHAHTARQNRKRRGASGAPRKPHTSQKQAKTEAQPRTPQTADTRGTTPPTVPKHTHPKPQPGLAGLTKPTPNRQPDPNRNAAQQWETQCPQPGH